MVLLKRTRYIIRRKDTGKVFCGLAKHYQFKSLDNIGDTAIKTYRSESQALASFEKSWWGEKPEIEIVKVKETIEVEIELEIK